MNRYDKEFKQQAVQLILEQGKSVNQTAKELGVSNETLYHWVRLYREDQEYAFPGSGKLKPDDQAIRDMKKRIRDLEEENAILKKSLGIFAKDRG